MVLFCGANNLCYVCTVLPQRLGPERVADICRFLEQLISEMMSDSVAFHLRLQNAGLPVEILDQNKHRIPEAVGQPLLSRRFSHQPYLKKEAKYR